MTETYPPNSLGNLLFRHDNNYGVDILEAGGQDKNTPNLTVAIPYFQARNTINLVLDHLFRSADSVREASPRWEYEILVVDDGSINYPAEEVIQPTFLDRISLISHTGNLGRFAARNTAIRQAKHEFLLFSDADVLINEAILRRHLNIMGRGEEHGKNLITTSLFNFVDFRQLSDNLGNLFLMTNDFRVKCKYREAWIGCEDDKRYIGQEFEILKQTNDLRNWPRFGFFGPWVLSNMVLGGLFGVSRDLAKAVGGCDRLFSGYGFEETSLVTKLIALRGSYVVPVEKNYAVHISDSESTLSQKEKDYFFQKSHELYFDEYLNYDPQEAVKEKI